MASITFTPSNHQLSGTLSKTSEVDVIWSVRNMGDAPAGAVMFISPEPGKPAGLPSNGGKTVKIDGGATVELEAFYRLTRPGAVTLYAIVWDHARQEVARHQFTAEMEAPVRVVKPPKGLPPKGLPPKGSSGEWIDTLWNPVTGTYQEYNLNDPRQMALYEAALAEGHVNKNDQSGVWGVKTGVAVLPVIPVIPVAAKQMMVTLYDKDGNAITVQADLVEGLLSQGYSETPQIASQTLTIAVASKPEEITIYHPDGRVMTIDSSLISLMTSDGWSTEEVEVQADEPPEGYDFFKDLGVFEGEYVANEIFPEDDGYTLLDRQKVQADEPPEAHKYFTDLGVFEKEYVENVIYEEDDGFVALDREEVQMGVAQDYDVWQDTSEVKDYFFELDVPDTMEGRIIAFEAASPYGGTTLDDILAGLREEEEEPEPFEFAPFYEEPEQVDDFQDTHDYFEEIGAFDPVYEEVVIYEEDDGYVWADPTPVTYVDYWDEG